MQGSGGHTFVVGGIYGRMELLEAVLAAIRERSAAGTVVFLGNYGAGADGAVRVVDRLMAGPEPGWRWVCLLGSDEHELLEVAGGDPVGTGLPSYGLQTAGARDYGTVPSAHLEWFAKLPLTFEDQFRAFVHAGVDDGFGLNELPAETALYAVATRATGDYRGKHIVHAHVPASPATQGNRTSVEQHGFGREGTLVAMFDDQVAGGPIELLLAGAGAAGVPLDDVASWRRALVFEEEQLARLRSAMARGGLNDVQRANWGPIVTAHQRSIFEYRQRLASIALGDLMQTISDSLSQHGTVLKPGPALRES